MILLEDFRPVKFERRNSLKYLQKIYMKKPTETLDFGVKIVTKRSVRCCKHRREHAKQFQPLRILKNSPWDSDSNLARLEKMEEVRFLKSSRSGFS